MTLDRIPSGTRVLIDSSIFIYYFTGASVDCRACLERCARGDLSGITPVVALVEVAHRLMMIEIYIGAAPAAWEAAWEDFRRR